MVGEFVVDDEVLVAELLAESQRAFLVLETALVHARIIGLVDNVAQVNVKESELSTSISSFFLHAFSFYID